MGAIALQAVMGEGKITSLRGRFFTIDKIGETPLGKQITVYCTYMPAVLFRRWEDYPIVREDFRKLGRLLREGWKEGELGDYKVLKTVNEVREIVDYLLVQPRFAFDLETTSFDFWDFSVNPDCNILCMSFSAYPGTGFVVPFLQQHGKPFWKSNEEAIEVVKELNRLFSSDTPKWAQNGSFDINFLRANGFEFNLDSFTFDTMLGHHTIQENIPHGLDTLIGLYTNLPLYSYELVKWEQEYGEVTTYAEFPDELLWCYSGADADATVRVGDLLEQELNQEMTERWVDGVWQPFPIREFFDKRVMPLSRALVDVEYEEKEMAVEGERTKEINCLLGRTINLRSSQQLQAALFNPPIAPSFSGWDGNGVNGKPYVPGLGLPITKRTKKGKPSTDESTLDLLFSKYKHPVLDILMAIKKSHKKISTYLMGKDGKSGMLKFVTENGKVHADYKQHTVVTGRLATTEPAIHNIPNPERDPEYAQIRTMFTAPPGWWLLQCDYSQLELKIIATIAQEQTMLDAFAEGKDIHRWVASEIEHITYEAVTTAQRKKAKDTNFGIIYGKGVWSLAKDLNVSVQEAQAFLDAYFIRFAGLARYFDHAKNSMKERGFVTNNFGRKRRLYGYQFLNEVRMRRYSDRDEFLKECQRKRAEMERQAVNFGVQSTGSDLLSTVTAKVHQEYICQGMESKIVISHHDALYIITSPEEIFKAAYLLVKIMEAPVPELNNVSFSVDLKVGVNWGHVDENVTQQVLDYISSVG
jgi:DNA polymerase-1